MLNKAKMIVSGVIFTLLHIIVFSVCIYHAMTWYYDYPFSNNISVVVLVGTEILILAEFFLLQRLSSTYIIKQNLIMILAVWDVFLLVLRVGFYYLLMCNLLPNLKTLTLHTVFHSLNLKNSIGSLVAWALPLQLVLLKLRLLYKIRYVQKLTAWIKWQVILSFIPVANFFLLIINLLYYRKRELCGLLPKKFLMTTLCAGVFCVGVFTVLYCLIKLKMELVNAMSLLDGVMLIFSNAMILYGTPLLVDLGMISVQCRGQGDGSAVP